MVFSADTHTDDFLQAHTGRFWRHHLRTHGDICKRSQVQTLYCPPFNTPPCQKRLFCCIFTHFYDEKTLNFRSIPVLEKCYWSVKKAPNGPFSLTGKKQGSTLTAISHLKYSVVEVAITTDSTHRTDHHAYYVERLSTPAQNPPTKQAYYWGINTRHSLYD